MKTSTYPDLTAEGIYIVDIPSFTPLYERNMQQQFLPASTTKVITALVTYDLFDPDNIVTVNRVITEGQTMGLTVGEKITVENLLYGILVHSGNDAAYALADHYGYEKFIEAMNQKAKQLGMNNTHFKNPAGLDDYEQYTTPFDMTLAARELLKNKMLSKIVSTRDITVADSQFINFHRLSNVNKLLGEVHGIGGLKTGYTDNAGENLISLYKSNGYQYIITILKSRDRFADTKAVVKWLNGNVEYIKL
ncbi:D-alanyl-D-alanine carboxypeptidase [Candidatus Roizmanbacteria bacterium]|nr:D-alanyl-D-alanine carboxypeptidase [Candidatus Roizmanbacteria bacterium]